MSRHYILINITDEFHIRICISEKSLCTKPSVTRDIKDKKYFQKKQKCLKVLLPCILLTLV